MATTEAEHIQARQRRRGGMRWSALAEFAHTRDAFWLALIFAAAVVLRLALLPTSAYLTDVFTDEFTFKRHVVFIRERGLIESFRDTNTSYVFYQYVLWLLSLPYGWLGGAFDTSASSLRILVKIPPLLFDVALIATVYGVARRMASQAEPRRVISAAAPLIAAALVAFHPVVVYDSAVWAQIDAVVAISALGAIAFAARGQPVAASAMLAFGLLNKPQPVIFAPLVAVLIWRTAGPLGVTKAAAVGGALMLAPLLPWLAAGDASRIVHVYRKLFANGGGNVTALTQNAWNLWWFIPFEKVPQAKDALTSAGGVTLTYQRFSLILSAAAAVAALVYSWRFPTLRGGLIAASYIAVAFYVLPTSTHERYMYPMVALLAPVMLVDGRFRYLYAALSLTLFANMFLVAPPVASWSRRWDDATWTHYIAGANVLAFAIFSWLLTSDLVSEWRGGGASAARPHASSDERPSEREAI